MPNSTAQVLYNMEHQKKQGGKTMGANVLVNSVIGGGYFGYWNSLRCNCCMEWSI